MPIMFFYFLKIIFNISISKQFKKYKPHSILAKTNIQNLTKRRLKRTVKQALNTTITVVSCSYTRVFGSVVVVAFQIAFRAEIHANDVFLFFKNYF
jgi:hypothetical protein